MKPNFRCWLAGLLAALFTATAGHAAEKQIVIYSVNDTILNQLVFSRFTQDTGIEVQPVAAGSGVLMKRIATEKDRPLGDVIWGISRSLLEGNKQYFAPYRSQHADAIPNEYKDPDGLWIGTNLHLLCLIQNTKLLPADAGPNTWSDLLDSKWKGKIAMTDPANSGNTFTNVTLLVDMWGGGDAGWKKVEQLFGNAKLLNKFTLVPQGVGGGEYPLGVSVEHAGFLWAKNGAPIKVIYPTEGNVVAMDGVALIKGGPNTETAKAFIDFINRKDIREMILGQMFRRPARQDLDLAKIVPDMRPLSEIKLLPYDEAKWTESRAATLDKIRDLRETTR